MLVVGIAIESKVELCFTTEVMREKTNTQRVKVNFA
jgi:hypothetical protein